MIGLIAIFASTFIASGALSAEAPLAAPLVCNDRVFRIRTNFWVSLHMLLRAEARRQRLGLAPELAVDDLPASEKAIWLSSIAAYSPVAQKIVYDPSMTPITDALAEVGNGRRVSSVGIPPALAQALLAAAPVYRKHLWQSDRAEEDKWIGDHCRDIQRFDRPIEIAIARAFGFWPPRKPIVVDLAREVGRNFAFTATGLAGAAGHTILSPTHTAGKHVALTTIFHEISHTMDDRIIPLVEREAKRQNVSVPEYLWHAMTLYTTSVLTQDQLEREGQSTSDVLADRIALFQRSHWEPLLPIFDREWRPHLEGKTSLASALASTIRQASKLGGPAQSDRKS
jgi:hypothetical protein